MAAIRTIAQDVTIGRQSASYVETCRYGDHRLRVDIRSDAYDVQSHAKISRWDDTRWQSVYFISYDNMLTSPNLCHQDTPVTISQFATDRDKLIDVAIQIVSN
jgi:hypothetical protein